MIHLRPSFRLAGLTLLGLVTVSTLRAQQAAPPKPPASPTLARVEGRVITQDDFDRVAQPYLARLRADMKAGFNDEVRRHANYNVMEELIRREVLIVEGQRQKLTVTEAETDRILKQDPFFHTNGTFDAAKFRQYKINPGTNYLEVLPRIRELAIAGKLDSLTRARMTPSATAVRAEWAKRTDQLQMKMLMLSLRDVSLEPEASPAEIEDYYRAHPDQFERKARIRIRYVRLETPPPGDPARDSVATVAMARGRAIADSLRAGASLDSIGTPPEDTGLFESGAGIPGIGAIPELSSQLTRAEADTTMRWLGPVLADGGVIVAEVVERQAKRVPPLAEVRVDAKRRADAEKRRTTSEADKRAYYEAHRDEYRGARARLTRVLLAEDAAPAKPLSTKELERAYSDHGREWLALPDSVFLPPLNDSLRAALRGRGNVEARRLGALRAVSGIAAAWRSGRDVRPLARTARAVVETLTITKGAAPDTLFPGALIDSLFQQTAGSVGGPRLFRGKAVAWRIDHVDTNVVATFEEVRARIEQGFNAEKRAKEEADGRAWFEAHKTDYKTKPKYVVGHVSVKIPPPDSIRIDDAELHAYYQSHLDSYRQEEQVRARHILLGTRPNQLPEPVAKARADSLRAAIVAGASFEDLARTFSSDLGSGANGGDLGMFGRGRMVKEFADTSFALELGRVSQPVKTMYGYHLIRVDEKKPAGVRPFDEVREDLRRQLAQTRGDSLARREADAMRRRIVRGEDPAKVAAARGGVVVSAPFAANESIPGLGMPTGLTPALDSLAAGRWTNRVFKAGDAYLFARLDRKVPPTQADFTEVRFQAIEDAKNAKRKELLAAKVAAVRARLQAGAPLDSVALDHGGLKDSGPVSRSAAFVPFLGAEPRIIGKAFAMKRGEVSDTLTTAQGVAWIKVEERSTVAGATFAKDRPAIVQEIQQKNYTAWLDARKKSMRIEVLRADLREKPKPITQTITLGGGN